MKKFENFLCWLEISVMVLIVIVFLPFTIWFLIKPVSLALEMRKMVKRIDHIFEPSDVLACF